MTARSWLPDLGAGLLVAFVGVLEASTTEVYSTSDSWALMLLAVGVGAAVGLARRAPGAALALVWALFAVQVLGGLQILVIEGAVGAVAFGTARWGSAATVWISGLSIPAVTLASVGFYSLATVGGLPFVDNRTFVDLVRLVSGAGSTWQAGAAVVGVALLGAPWLAGLAVRLAVRARASEASQEAAQEDAARAVHETEQAREIARLREEQARLARDVHDVVGHSLAVILAQAESAQFLPDTDTEKLKATMATIATSARASLQDVRQVLTATPSHPGGPRPGGLDSLLAGVRSSGHEVVSTEEGTPQPLPPELEVVAFRVLQEMLTNAIKHGRRDQPLWVERHWPDGSFGGDLRLEVRNVEAGPEPVPGAPASPGPGHQDETRPMQSAGPAPAAGGERDVPGGQGVEGMRRRLESVGGRLDVRRRAEPVGPTFTVTAWVPVRG